MRNSTEHKIIYVKGLVLAGGLLVMPFLETVSPAAGSEVGAQQIATRVPTYTPTATRTPNVRATEIAVLESELAASKSEIQQIRAAATLQANAVATAVSGNAEVEYRLRRLEMFDRMSLVLAGGVAALTAGFFILKKFGRHGGHGGGHGH